MLNLPYAYSMLNLPYAYSMLNLPHTDSQLYLLDKLSFQNLCLHEFWLFPGIHNVLKYM
jgi:hypothetical protein